jgi:hypothetical protein
VELGLTTPAIGGQLVGIQAARLERLRGEAARQRARGDLLWHTLHELLRPDSQLNAEYIEYTLRLYEPGQYTPPIEEVIEVLLQRVSRPVRAKLAALMHDVCMDCGGRVLSKVGEACACGRDEVPAFDGSDP